MTHRYLRFLGPHPALTFLIRGTGALWAGVCGWGLAVMLFGMIADLSQMDHSPWWLLFLSGSCIILILGLFGKIGYDMARRVDATAVYNFSFIYAYLTAWILYHPVPRIDPIYFGYHSQGNPLIFPSHFSTGADPGMWIFAFISFFIFKSLYQAALLKILGLSVPAYSKRKSLFLGW